MAREILDGRAFRRPMIGTRGVGAVILAGALASVYAVTLAPGLTWLHHGADGGDLIAAAASGGVAHPSGYPAYLLLARLFLQLPFGSPAFRTNLLSSVCAALAAVLTGDIVWQAHGGRRSIAFAAGLLAGFAFGLSPLLWSQAVITEVYALQALLVAASLRALPIGSAPQPAPAWVRWGGLTGVALATHLTSILLVPAGLIALWFTPPAGRWRRLIAAGFGLATGASLYVLLPVWASRHPAVNWGEAGTWSGFVWVVTGGPYRGLMFNAGNYFWTRLMAGAGLWVDQFGVAGLLVGLGGLFRGGLRSKALPLILVWICLSFSLFAIGYNTVDSYLYLIPAALAFAICFGLGIAAGLEAGWRRQHRLAPLAVALFGLLIFINAVPAMAQADASRADAAERFGQSVLQTAPPGAILITTEDRDSFGLWYWREAAHQRRDLVVIVEGLISFAWYREQLQRHYPQLAFPAGGTPDWLAEVIRRNPRPVCRTLLDGPEVLDCFAGGQ